MLAIRERERLTPLSAVDPAASSLVVFDSFLRFNKNPEFKSTRYNVNGTIFSSAAMAADQTCY